ncbi:MAG TPA: YbaB/EbfC family nucleoid-associated protein [Acholeplasma sp.]|nr:YbaB/EbfC family nucleoid-associated protein [Acholeplasma sp.]
MNPSMIRKLKKMQEEMEKAQRELESKEYFGKSSGVVVIMQGTRQVLDVQIDPDLLEEVELLQDSILIAVNDALNQIETEQSETMGQFTGGMGGLGF